MGLASAARKCDLYLERAFGTLALWETPKRDEFLDLIEAVATVNRISFSVEKYILS